MAKFDIQYATGVPRTQAQAAPMQVSPEFEAYSRVGEAIFQLGSKLQQQKNAVDYSEGQRQIDEQINAALESLTGNEKDDMEVWNKLQEDVSAVKYDNRKVDRSLEIYRNNVLPNAQQAISKKHKTLLQQNVHDRFEAEGQTFLAKGDLTGYQDLLDMRLASKDISQTQYDALAKTALSDSLVQQTRDLVASPNAADQKMALQMLDTIPNMKGIEFSTEQKEYLQKLRSVAKRNSNVISQEANKELTDLMLGGNVSPDDVMARRAELDDEDYKSWAKIALSPIDKAGNVIEATRLKTLSMDVWRGTLSREDVEKQIRDSLSVDGGINDKQYASIYDELNREVKSYQAQDMKTYAMEATRLILGKDAGVMTFDSLGNMTIDMSKLLSPQQDFEKKMYFVDQYNKGMLDFLADNPTASKKELYVKSQELKSTYLSASKGGTAQQVEQKIPRPQTQAEYDLLPSGTIYIDTDGIKKEKR